MVRRLLGRHRSDVMAELTHRYIRRFEVFVNALEFVDFEKVEGDVMEFGVFGGSSLALLGKAVSFGEGGRNLIGFDSFAGLPISEEEHASWKPGDCGLMHGWHPTLPAGAPVTPRVTYDLFELCGLAPPQLEVGRFEETVPRFIHQHSRPVAVVHFDCDLYESTRTVLTHLEPVLQDGSVLLFDDWFHYRANPGCGEARALSEFLDENPQWGAVHYRVYATFCNSFILYRR